MATEIDIVTELRNTWLYDSKSIGVDVGERAADEIERLRRTMAMMVIDYRTQIAGLKMRCNCEGINNGI